MRMHYLNTVLFDKSLMQNVLKNWADSQARLLNIRTVWQHIENIYSTYLNVESAILI